MEYTNKPITQREMMENILKRIVQCSDVSESDYYENNNKVVKEEYFLEFPYIKKCIPEIEPIVAKMHAKEFMALSTLLGKPLHVRKTGRCDGKPITEHFKTDGKNIYLGYEEIHYDREFRV